MDYTKIYDGADKKYKYGVLKVNAIQGEEIEVLVSDIAYKKKSGPRRDIREGKAEDRNYYSSQSAFFNKNELIQVIMTSKIGIQLTNVI